MGIPQQAIVDAWLSAQGGVQKLLAKAHVIQLEDHQIKYEPTRLGSPIGWWGVFRFHDLYIDGLHGIELQMPTFPEAGKVLLPIHFSGLRVEGRYQFDQENDQHFDGDVRESFSNGTISFHADTDNQLTLTGLSIAGAATVTIEADPQVEIPSRSWWPGGEETERFEKIQHVRSRLPTTIPIEDLVSSLDRSMRRALENWLEGSSGGS